MLGVWLTISPFVFRHSADEKFVWVNDLACGSLVIACSCLAFWEPARHARFGTLAVSLWLLASAYLAAGHPAAPALQNELLTGLLLAMFAIIPNDAALPPRSWREFTNANESKRYNAR
jgi:hypothetical protein